MSEKAWLKNVRKVTPYVPGEQPQDLKKIKLNTNENPYPPSKGVMEALKEFDTSVLKLYPTTDAKELRKTLADYHKVEEKNLFIGVGSDDVLATCFMTFFCGEKPTLFADITYSFYEVWAKFAGINYKLVPLKENFRQDEEAYYEENGGIVIANPNAPTSIAESKELIERIVKANPESVVIIDEAYVDFGGESVIGLTEKYDNLLVVRTFSKSRSLAGLRIGYAVGNEDLINAMFAVRDSINSYTINTIAVKAAVASVLDEEYFQSTLKKIVATRERAALELEKLGFDVLPSSANFLYVTHKTRSAVDLQLKLRNEHIFVRYFKKPERISNYLRISVGTDEEMDRLIEVLSKEIQ
ncbi:MAG: histidinol-phosphate transaminase [Lachnospiraceae bacterium]|nr:histidinol-phosphate transaminase [Lachnospiraceae bacterium]